MTTKAIEAGARAAFIAAHKHLDLTETKDAWGEPMFAHSHVEAMWSGWQAALASGALERDKFWSRSNIDDVWLCHDKQMTTGMIEIDGRQLRCSWDQIQTLLELIQRAHGYAIASGELVPASAVAAERERCAKVAGRIAKFHEDGRDACMSEGPPNTKGALTQARQAQTASAIAAAIRALSPEPESGEFVVVPREPTRAMVQAACDATFGPNPLTPEEFHRAGYASDAGRRQRQERIMIRFVAQTAARLRAYLMPERAEISAGKQIIQTSAGHQLIRLAITPKKPITRARLSIPSGGIEKWDGSWRDLGLPGSLPLWWSNPNGNSSVELSILNGKTVFALIDVPPASGVAIIYSPRPDGPYTQYNGEFQPGRYRVKIVLFSGDDKICDFYLILQWYGDASTAFFEDWNAATKDGSGTP